MRRTTQRRRVVTAVNLQENTWCKPLHQVILKRWRCLASLCTALGALVWSQSSWAITESLSGPVVERAQREQAVRTALSQAVEVAEQLVKEAEYEALKVPEVIIIPGGLSPEDLEVVNRAVASVVRQADDQDSREAARIRRRGRDAVITSLATRGYFDPEVTLEVGEDIEGETWDIHIESGERTTVQSVDLSFKGRILHESYQPRLEQIRSDWGLPVGEVFINDQWSDAKSDILQDVGREDFYLARMSHTQALIDPDEATAALHVTVDSGPAVRLGQTKIEGLKRVPERLINRYIRYEPGAYFSQQQLDEWQSTLQSTNFFRGAFVTIEKPEDDSAYLEDEVTLPVLVRVTEGPARSVTAALGIDDVNIVRGEAVYRQHVVWGRPITLEVGASLGWKEQRGYVDVFRAPNRNGSVDSFGLVARHSDIAHEDVRRVALGWRRTNAFKLNPRSRVDYETRWAAAIAYDSVKRDGLPKFELPNVVATYDVMRRDVDDPFDPRSGHLLVLGLGAGVDLERGDPFARTGLRAQHWWPVGRRDVFSLKGEVGYVYAADDTRIPEDFGYRTGGANTIRGYRYLWIGEKKHRSVVGTRTLAYVSAEYTHYLNNTVGVAAFVDAGDAARTFGEMRAHVGYGVGARVKTPAGPLSLDLAWGQRDQSLRLHFSLGMAF